MYKDPTTPGAVQLSLSKEDMAFAKNLMSPDDFAAMQSTWGIEPPPTPAQQDKYAEFQCLLDKEELEASGIFGPEDVTVSDSDEEYSDDDAVTTHSSSTDKAYHYGSPHPEQGDENLSGQAYIEAEYYDSSDDEDEAPKDLEETKLDFRIAKANMNRRENIKLDEDTTPSSATSAITSTSPMPGGILKQPGARPRRDGQNAIQFSADVKKYDGPDHLDEYPQTNTRSQISGTTIEAWKTFHKRNPYDPDQRIKHWLTARRLEPYIRDDDVLTLLSPEAREFFKQR